MHGIPTCVYIEEEKEKSKLGAISPTLKVLLPAWPLCPGATTCIFATRAERNSLKMFLHARERLSRTTI